MPGSHYTEAVSGTNALATAYELRQPISVTGQEHYLKDEIKGELACACVVRRAGAEVTAAELIDYTHDRLAAYKRPREVVFLSSLLATSTGKIMRRKLADARPPEV